MRRNGWIIAGLLVLLAVGFVLLKGSSPSGSPSATKPPVAPPPAGMAAKIVKPVGDVELTDKKQTNRAADGDIVHSGDEIKTGHGAQVSIEFFSGARTALDQDSDIVVSEASVDPVDWQKMRVRLTLTAGRVWSRILQLLDATSTYQVSYNGVVAGVRGTAFQLIGEPIRAPQDLLVDEFDGTVGLSGKTMGALHAGFSVQVDTRQPPADITPLITATPDDTRDDFWVRDQLRLDQDFAQRSIKIRNGLGANESAAGIGDEAGPFTLDQPGVKHSGFRTVRIENPLPNANLNPGQSVQLVAQAVFIDDVTGKETDQDVTSKANYQISDPSLATITSDGKLTAAEQNGTFILAARWNDGTHEHSGSMTFTVGTPQLQLNTNATILINGQPLK